MARKHLKIAERLISDAQIKDFFRAIDVDGGGEVEFTEFLMFIRTKEPNESVNQLILRQVKRVVRLAMQRQRMSIEDLERRFQNAAEEGIIDTAGSDNCLGPEEMRRFFRKVLDVSDHEAPDRNLAIAFRAMDEDGGGSLDAEEFMDFIRLSCNEETELYPKPQCEGEELRVPGLLGGTGGSLPARLPRSRPGTTLQGGRSQAPFCLNGRDQQPRTRMCASKTPTLIAPETPKEPWPQARLSSTLLPSGLPKSACSSPAGSPKSQRSRLLSTTSSFSSTAPAGFGGSLGHSASAPALGASTMSLPPLSPGNAREVSERGHYSAVKGMLGQRDAEMLNRLESQLFSAGVDLRGQFHKRQC